MADEQLDILIKVLSDTHGAKAVEEALKRQTQAVKEVAKATDESNRVEAKNISLKKQAKDAIKGLAFEFPILGRIANLALNPITLAVAGLTAAFKLWKFRITEATEAMSRFQMPDVADDQIDRLKSAAAALSQFAKEMANTQTVAASVKTDLAEVVRQIKLIDELKKAAGLSTGTQATEREIAAKEAAAARMEMDARARIAGAGTPGSKEAEEALGARYKAAAEAGLAAQAQARGALGQIAEWQNAPTWRRVYDDFRFRARYGYGTTYDQARAVEQGNIANAQIAIDQYGAFQASAASRAGRRQTITSAQGDLADVARLRQEVLELRGQLGVSRTAAAAAAVQGFPSQVAAASQSGDVAGLARAVIGLSTNAALVAEALRAAKYADDQLRGAVSDQRRN